MDFKQIIKGPWLKNRGLFNSFKKAYNSLKVPIYRNKGGDIVLVDSIERQEMDNVRLARIHPKAYEAKMKAGQESNPFKDFIIFLKNLLAKRTK